MSSKKTWETCEPAYRDLMLAEVDAAFDCLTVRPSEAMVRAGNDVLHKQVEDDSWPTVAASLIYKAMTAAMIKEGKK